MLIFLDIILNLKKIQNRFMAIYEVGWAFSPTKKILNYLGDPSLIIFIINCVHFFLFVAMQSGLSAEGEAVRAMSLTA